MREIEWAGVSSSCSNRKKIKIVVIIAFRQHPADQTERG